MSTGCVAACPPAELEGVLAHELAHVRLRDVAVQTAVVGRRGASMLETSRIGGWLERALLFVLGPVAAACVHLLVSPKREFEADRLAAELCDSPHGLADALLRLEQAAELVEFEGSPATEPLFTINPFAERGLGALFVTHPPVAERVRRLRELDPAWREKRPQRSRRLRLATKKSRSRGAFSLNNRRRPTLPGGCPPSTIGPGRLNFSVRNGKRCLPAGMTAELSKARDLRAAPSKLHSDSDRCSNQDLGQLVRVR